MIGSNESMNKQAVGLKHQVIDLIAIILWELSMNINDIKTLSIRRAPSSKGCEGVLRRIFIALPLLAVFVLWLT